jgi:predicted nucleic acid-binding protein
VVDAGPLYAYVDADDRHHEDSLDLLRTHPGPLLVPELVVTEVVYLIGTRLGTDAEVRLLGDLAGGDFAVESVAAGDWLRIAELAARYRDLPLGTVDASVVVVCERLNFERLATFDRRHFSVVRPQHTDALELVP